MLEPVWNTTISIDTTPDEDQPTYAELCAGIENFDDAMNEQTQQYFFMCGKGWAHNEVTGAAPAITVTGKRVHGDAAQDWIAGQQYKLARDRYTRVKIVSTFTDPAVKAEKTVTITCHATMTAINAAVLGSAKDNKGFSVTLSLNGKPEVETAA